MLRYSSFVDDWKSIYCNINYFSFSFIILNIFIKMLLKECKKRTCDRKYQSNFAIKLKFYNN